ncbi:hypothetical protein F2Q70_00022280 [Brassica cretica]|uniref:Uncharacterized protein n=1 Tax=Brassica cretica TaxID=69181 RepID=A0A8S9GMT7_BRACR|nr:hypothetical protein F2Q70_00022280 [Brassica cretica]
MSRDLVSPHLLSSRSQEWNPWKQKTPSVLLGQQTLEQTDGKYAGKDNQISGTNSEKQERRPRNKERPDRVVWTPLRRSDGSSISEDQLSSSTANNGEIKERMLLQRSGEVVNSSGGHSLENGSTRHSGRRVGARNRKEEGFAMTGEGKSSRRGGGGGGGPNSHEASRTKTLL